MKKNLTEKISVESVLTPHLSSRPGKSSKNFCLLNGLKMMPINFLAHLKFFYDKFLTFFHPIPSLTI